MISFRPLYMLSIRKPPLDKNIGRLKVKSWSKMYHANTNQKKVGLAINIRKQISENGKFPEIKQNAT